MPLDPLIRKILGATAQDQPIDTIAPEVARVRLKERLSRLPVCQANVGFVRDLSVPVGNRYIPVRLYRPVSPRRPPLLVFLHGGGWSLCDLDTHDAICRRLCADAGVGVLSVEYRLAPEHPFPAGFEDCGDVYDWALRNSDMLGVDVRCHAVAGDSAGGALAAGLCLARRDMRLVPPSAQILLYPALQHPSRLSSSYEEFAEGYGLTRRALMHFWDLYLGEGRTPTPYAAPLHADDLSNLPPTLIVTAEYDVLRDEGELFAWRLAEQGTEVELRRVLSVNHGFLALEAILPMADQALRGIGHWLKQQMTSGQEAWGGTNGT